MYNWLTIEVEKEDDSHLEEFIEANPVLDDTMRNLLANYLNLSEPNLRKWIQEYQNKASECELRAVFCTAQHVIHALQSTCVFLLNTQTCQP